MKLEMFTLLLCLSLECFSPDATYLAACSAFLLICRVLYSTPAVAAPRRRRERSSVEMKLEVFTFSSVDQPFVLLLLRQRRVAAENGLGTGLDITATYVRPKLRPTSPLR
jgi:hypothetical protein